MAQYSGSEWIASMFEVEPSPLGRRVADILGHVWQGIYNVNNRQLRQVDWKNTHHISIKLLQELATYDFNHLTQLLVLCHDAAIRLEIGPAKYKGRDEDGNKYVVPAIQLMFHQRGREGSQWQRHPTIEDAIARTRKLWERDRGPMTLPASGVA